MLTWKKKGLVFCPSGQGGWMHSHAQVPTVLVKRDCLRIYFATRSNPRLSLTTFVDVSREDPSQVLCEHTCPILEVGSPGMFDEHGVMPSYVTERDGEIWLYYGGWSRRESIPYSNWTGIAVSSDGGKIFRRMFSGPVIDRTPIEVFSATAPNIMVIDGTHHMWYACGKKWVSIQGKLEEYYTIVHGESSDGVRWVRNGEPIFEEYVPLEPKHRPAVFKYGGKYHMLFGKRKMVDFRDGPNSYRLGYASSNDLASWVRDDSKIAIETSEGDWDSTMIAYPYVVQYDGRTLLFYNGNGFGKSGFGYAELEIGSHE